MVDLMLEREGFWTRENKPQPHHLTKIEQFRTDKFVKLLKKVQSKAREIHYKGWHTCIICKEKVGTVDYLLEKWIWPEGYIHYIEKHGVNPTKRFKNFIITRAKS